MKSITSKAKLFFAIIMICSPVLLMAQPDDPPGGDDVIDTPLDGGVSLLLAAGVGYGLRKAYKQKKDQKAY